MLQSPFSLGCPHHVPDSRAPLRDIFSRWSDSNAQHPAIIATPRTEDDIAEAIRFSRENNLSLIPVNGGHASFVPIDSSSLCLVMSKFNRVALDGASGIAHIGGGALVGDVISTLTAEGFYTLWPDSDTVGFVGCLLGGGSNGLNGIHGFMVDAVLSFRLVAADGRIVEVGPTSVGDELNLFHALCGAGHGFGVVTSVKMQAWPIASLRMTDNKIWARRIVFPPGAIDTAARVFVQVESPPEPLSLVLVFARSPPTSPTPGAAMILLSASYYGPAEEAEIQTRQLFDPDIVRQATRSETAAIPFGTANKAFEAVSAHGGSKDITSCHLRTTDVEMIKAVFSLWLQFTKDNDDAKQSLVILGQNSIANLAKNGSTPSGKGKYLSVRDRGLGAFALTWFTQPETRAAQQRFRDDFLTACRRHDGAPPRTFANNMRRGMNLEELQTRERTAELKQMARLWDPEGLFWSPYGERDPWC